MAFVKGSAGATTGGAGGTGVFTVTLSFTPTSANDTLIIMPNLQASTNTSALSSYLTSVTDNAGGGSSTYTQPATNFATRLTGSLSVNSWIAYCTAVKSGVTTITANFNTATLAMNFGSLFVLEYSGLGAFGMIGAMTESHLTTACSSGSVSVTSGYTAIGVIIDWTNPDVTAVTSPTSTFDFRDTTPATYASASAVQGVTGSLAATFTKSTSTDTGMAALLAFQPGGAVLHPAAWM
jgi:hypothetical protein